MRLVFPQRRLYRSSKIWLWLQWMLANLNHSVLNLTMPLLTNFVIMLCMCMLNARVGTSILAKSSTHARSLRWRTVGCFQHGRNLVLLCSDKGLFRCDCVLSICSGSGSLMQACMETGRSCIAIEINGFNFDWLTFLRETVRRNEAADEWMFDSPARPARLCWICYEAYALVWTTVLQTRGGTIVLLFSFLLAVRQRKLERES